MAGRVNITEVYQGEDRVVPFQLLDGGTPLNVNSWTIQFRVGLKGNEAVLTKTASIVGDGSTGEVDVALTAAELAIVALGGSGPPGYVFELRRTDSGSARTLVTGSFALQNSLFVEG